MAFWAYLLQCRGGAYYVGHTDDLARRLAEHEAGAVQGFTSFRRPVHLAWSQAFPTREEALAAEMQVKRWSRRKKAALAAGDWAGLRAAARKKFREAE